MAVSQVETPVFQLGIGSFRQILLVVVFSAAIAKILQRIIKNLTLPIREIPSPPGHFLLGHLPAVVKNDPAEVHAYWLNNFSKNGMTRVNYVYGPERIVISRLGDVKKVLITEGTKFRRPAAVVNALPSMSFGVLAAEGKEHAWQRKLLHPSFTSTSVKQFANLFIEQASLLVKVWTEKIEDTNGSSCTLVVEDDISKMLFDAICKAAFGYEMKTLLNVKDEKSEALHTLTRGLFGYKNFFMNKYFGFLGRYLTLFGAKDITGATKVATNLISQVIASKEKKLKSQGDTDVQSHSRPDLLEIMMKLRDAETGSRMSEEVLKSNVMTFMIAGYDTSSSCLTWTLYLLAQHLDKQEKARKEILNAWPQNSTVTLESIEKMPYVEYVLKESLRLYPPAPFIARETISPITLGGVCIPKGYDVVIPAPFIHRSEEFWKDASKFEPERFDIEQRAADWKKDAGLQFLPFSFGPRQCIGSKFAMLEMRIVMATLLKNFKFSISPTHPDVKGQLTLLYKPTPSPTLKLELVQNN